MSRHGRLPRLWSWIRGPSRPARRRNHRREPGIGPWGSQELEPRVLLSIFTVSNTQDGGAGSLRQAITSANGQSNGGSPDEIHFAIGGSGVQTIKPASALPAITDPVLLLATTQTGYAGVPLIELVGTGAGTGADGLAITAGGTTVSGLVINRFSGDGIVLATKGGDTVTACYIGTDSSGELDKGNTGFGLRISGASSNIIGGHNDSTALIGAGNVISGNDSGGVAIVRGPKFPQGEPATYNVLLGNFIGTDATGQARIGNFGHGVSISTGSNQIGDGSMAGDNVILGNVGDGLIIQGAFASGNAVQGNYIGWFGGGTLGNGGDGVSLASGASGTTIEFAYIGANGGNGVVIDGSGTKDNILKDNKIGYPGPNALDGVKIADATGNTIGGGNSIVGNGGNGIEITGAAATGNLVLSNLIGGGGNTLDGVKIADSPGNTIGGTAADAGNVIVENSRNGIEITGAAATGNRVLGNFIGLNPGSTPAQGNLGSGVVLDGAANNTIGGTAAGAGNVISSNGLSMAGVSGGILIYASAGTLVQGNLVGTNADGTTAMGNMDGIFVESSANNTIGGTAAGAGNVISGNLGNGILIFPSNSVLVQGNRIGTDATGAAALGNAGDGIQFAGPGDNTIGGTADGAGNVISGNTGDGIALYSANDALVQGNHIGTDATGKAALGNGHDGIQLAGAMNNTIGGTDPGAGNLISGNVANGIDLLVDNVTQEISTGNLIQGNRIGTDAAGAAALGNGLGVDIYVSPGNTIGGTSAGAGNVISGNTGNGIVIHGSTASANLVQGNLVGTDAAGSARLGNGINGIVLLAPGNTIGGTVAGARNIISANPRGILIDTADALDNLVEGNYLGTDAAGVAPLGNDGPGIRIDGGDANTIGGTAAGAGNVISGNGAEGIDLPGGTGNLVQGNLIGTAADGVAPLGNGGTGIAVGVAPQTTIGGTAAGAANTIAFNGGAGVAVTGGLGDLISSDRIHDNGGLGIDLGDDGVTPNDPGDADNGSNLQQNFPVIASAVNVGGQTIISAALDSVASRSFTLEWFASVAADPTGFGEGASFLGTTTAVTDVSGHASLPNLLPFTVPLGRFLIATATDQDGDTSEFSRAALVQGPALVQWSVSSLVVDENAGIATLLVTRTGDPDVPVTVHVATAGGDAQPGINYTPVDTMLSFPSGVLSRSLTIALRDDGSVAPDRRVVVTLDRPSLGSVLGTPASTTLVIRNTDASPPGHTDPSSLVKLIGVRLVTDRRKNVTQVIVSLTGVVDAGQAQQLTTYRFATAGKRGSFDAKNARALKLRSARYDAATATVTITPFRSFRLGKTIQFRINGSVAGGLVDPSGRLIDGDHDDRPGGNAIALLRKTGVTIA